MQDIQKINIDNIKVYALDSKQAEIQMTNDTFHNGQTGKKLIAVEMKNPNEADKEENMN